MKINLAPFPTSIKKRKKRPYSKPIDVVLTAKEYGQMYFDGPLDESSYEGYYYDPNTWLPIAKNIIDYFQLKSGNKILDIGCAKGFLVKALKAFNPQIEAFGIDISEYAIKNCEPEVVGYLHLGNAINLPFPDNSFNVVISLNTIHNLSKDKVILSLKEIQRLSYGKAFVQVHSYETIEQKEIFESWALTPEYHDYPEGWIKTFLEAGYCGDYYWTIM